MKAVFLGIGITLLWALAFIQGAFSDPGESVSEVIIYSVVISWGVSLIGALTLWAGKPKAGVFMVTVGSIGFVPLGLIAFWAALRVGNVYQASLERRRQCAKRASPWTELPTHMVFARKQARLWTALWLLVLLLGSVPFMLVPESHVEVLSSRALILSMEFGYFPLGALALQLWALPFNQVLETFIAAFSGGVFMGVVGCWYFVSPVVCFGEDYIAFTLTPFTPTRTVLNCEIDYIEQQKNRIIIYYRRADLKPLKSARKVTFPFRYLLEDEDQMPFLEALSQRCTISSSADKQANLSTFKR